MNDVETIYTQYEDIVSEFTEQVIKNQYASLYRECTAFLESLGVSDHTRIDKAILTHTVMDYFTDISRMKEFHHVKHISERKALAYETYWILRRKPIQVMINNGILGFPERKVFLYKNRLLPDTGAKVRDSGRSFQKNVLKLSGYPLLLSEIPDSRSEDIGTGDYGIPDRTDGA